MVARREEDRRQERPRGKDRIGPEETPIASLTATKVEALLDDAQRRAGGTLDDGVCRDWLREILTLGD